jgi:NADPH-dependent glutamate synthase beta subunit-like oxidoreductase
MPANPWEIEQAAEEGVELLYSWGPHKILENDGKVAGLELVRCTSVFDAEGNFCPFFDETTQTIATDQVILAIGQASETAFCRDFCFLEEQSSLKVERGLIAIDPKTQETELKGVFAGGDAANGPATVIEAIAAGRRAAASIDLYLGGDGDLDSVVRIAEAEPEQPYDGKRTSGFAELDRVAAPSLPLSERQTGFAEVELGYGEKEMLAEVGRCLQCDLEICLARQASERELRTSEG